MFNWKFSSSSCCFMASAFLRYGEIINSSGLYISKHTKKGALSLVKNNLDSLVTILKTEWFLNYPDTKGK